MYIVYSRLISLETRSFLSNVENNSKVSILVQFLVLWVFSLNNSKCGNGTHRGASFLWLINTRYNYDVTTQAEHLSSVLFTLLPLSRLMTELMVYYKQYLMKKYGFTNLLSAIYMCCVSNNDIMLAFLVFIEKYKHLNFINFCFPVCSTFYGHWVLYLLETVAQYF